MKVLILALLLAIPFPSVQDDKVTVYVYSLKHVKTLWRAAFPVYIDDKQVAKLDGERYFVAKLSPGKHVFRLKDKKRGGLDLKFEAGKTYYVRMEMREGATVGPVGLTLVPIENATYEIKQMKSINKGDIKDPLIVSSQP
jgi:uncharacterized protein DUF2846